MMNTNAQTTSVPYMTTRSSVWCGRDSLAEAYNAFAVLMFRYAVALTGSTDDAEDAVQDVFARLARKPPARVADLRAYLLTGTRNSAFSILRARKRRRGLDETIADVLEHSPALSGSGAVEAIAARQAFLALPDDQREVLFLKVFCDLTFQEIARTVGTSANTAASRYRYGISKLRTALGEDNNG